jgi:hypothetical protein
MANVYDLPVKYNKAARAYVVTVQTRTKKKLGVYEVTLEHGDRALPHGFVTAGEGAFVTYMFAPGYARDHARGRAVGASKSLQEAIEDVRKSFEQRI